MTPVGDRQSAGHQAAFQPLLIAAALLGITGVVLGALGAHALRGDLTPAALGTWQTAVLYHLIHAPAVLAIALAARASAPAPALLRWAGLCLVLGVLLFSGSLYLLALGAGGLFGPITPLGGLFLIAGWALVLLAGLGVGRRAS